MFELSNLRRWQSREVNSFETYFGREYGFKMETVDRRTRDNGGSYRGLSIVLSEAVSLAERPQIYRGLAYSIQPR